MERERDVNPNLKTNTCIISDKPEKLYLKRINKITDIEIGEIKENLKTSYAG